MTAIAVYAGNKKEARRWAGLRIWWIVNLAGAAALIVFWASLQIKPFDGSAAAYFNSELGPDLYDRVWNTDPRAYVYPPPFRQIIEPLTWLSWPAFYAVWSGVLTISLAWLVRPLFAAILLLPWEPFRHSIATGDVALLMAVALVASPAAWAVLPLSKVTPGAAFVWFAVRREWHSLATALGVTTVIVAVSFALGPDLWAAWLGRMIESTEAAPIGLPVPALARLPLALAVVIVAALRGWRWLLPVAVVLALPNLTWASLVVIAAVPRLAVESWRRSVDRVEAKLVSVQPASRAVTGRVDSHLELVGVVRDKGHDF